MLLRPPTRVVGRTCALAASRVSSKPSSRASARQASNRASRVRHRAWPVASAALPVPCPSATDSRAGQPRPRSPGAAWRTPVRYGARNRRDAEAVADPLDGIAGALELLRQRRSVFGARPLLRLVQLAADDGAPGAVPARRQVEDEHVAVQLRIELAAGVMVEGGHQQPGRRLAHGAAFATARPRGRPLQVARRRRDRGSVRALDCRPVARLGQRPQHGYRFRRAERHVPAGGMVLQPATQALRAARLSSDRCPSARLRTPIS